MSVDREAGAGDTDGSRPVNFHQGKLRREANVGDNHWLPTLISVDGDERRALDLFDDDDWRWALLARSKAVGIAEVVHRADGKERVTWPLPAQLRAAMDIIGVPAGPWCWRVVEDAPDLWSLLR